MDEKHIGKSTLKSLVAWIRRMLGKKLDSVTNRDDSIEVADRRELSVRISQAAGNRLQVKTSWGEKGLYVPPDEDLPIATDEEIDEMIDDVFGREKPIS